MSFFAITGTMLHCVMMVEIRAYSLLLRFSFLSSKHHRLTSAACLNCINQVQDFSYHYNPKLI